PCRHNLTPSPSPKRRGEYLGFVSLRTLVLYSEGFQPVATEWCPHRKGFRCGMGTLGNRQITLERGYDDEAMPAGWTAFLGRTADPVYRLGADGGQPVLREV